MKLTELERAFLQDHRLFTRGLSRLLHQLEQDELSAAIETAGELDRVGGSHIEFEETALYPSLVEALGTDTVRRLYREHREGLRVVRALSGRSKPLDEGEKETLIEGVHVALKHVETCGTLLSHVGSFPEPKRAELLRHLEDCRARARPWTDLPWDAGELTDSQQEDG